MALRFLGRDPNSDGGKSPTVWLDEVTGDYVMQGWRITDQATMSAVGTVPTGETVIRFPRRMLQFFSQTSGGSEA